MNNGNRRRNIPHYHVSRNCHHIGTSDGTTNNPNYQEILQKEYELCFNRSTSIYDLMNEVIKLYTTVFFAVISVFGFTSTDTYGDFFGNGKTLHISLMTGLLIYGYVTLFMHIANWAARNYYRRKREQLQYLVLGIYKGESAKEALIQYLITPKYLDGFVFHNIGLCLWYYLYIFFCNSIATILLASMIFETGTNQFFFFIGTLVFMQLLSSKIYVKLKITSHKKKSMIRYNELQNGIQFDFFSSLSHEIQSRQ